MENVTSVWFVCTDNPWGIDYEMFFFDKEKALEYYNSLIADNKGGDDAIVHIYESEVPR